MEIGEKIKLIREAEGLSQLDFAAETGINFGTLRNYEQRLVTKYNTQEILKITQHAVYGKYTLWLMTDKEAPQVGQVAPAGGQ